MAPLSAAASQLLAQLLESIFWGIYVVTLGFCLKALLRTQNRWKRPAEVSKSMLLVAILTGCVATFDLCLTFLMSLNTFVFSDGPEGLALDNTVGGGWVDFMGVRSPWNIFLWFSYKFQQTMNVVVQVALPFHF
jgi:hypothetical protein